MKTQTQLAAPDRLALSPWRRSVLSAPQMAKYVVLPLAIVTLALIPITAIAEISVNMKSVNKSGVGKSIGTVVLTQTAHGVELAPQLSGLSPGLHGFHVHENPDCGATKKEGEQAEPGGAAGSHFDPKQKDSHDRPWGDGHLGDLPVLYVDGDGNADNPLLAPRLTLDQIKNRSLVIHAGADNYADKPKPLGGGGARVACGIIGGNKSSTER